MKNCTVTKVFLHTYTNTCNHKLKHKQKNTITPIKTMQKRPRAVLFTLVTHIFSPKYSERTKLKLSYSRETSEHTPFVGSLLCFKTNKEQGKLLPYTYILKRISRKIHIENKRFLCKRAENIDVKTWGNIFKAARKVNKLLFFIAVSVPCARV